jgi:hypothetical protein
MSLQRSQTSSGTTPARIRIGDEAGGDLVDGVGKREEPLGRAPGGIEGAVAAGEIGGAG